VNKAGTYSVSVGDKTPGCQPVKKSIGITVSATPNAPTATSVIVCQNSPATLTATAPGGVYQWYDKPVGGNFLATGATYTTPPIAFSSSFYVETTVGGCTSLRTAVFAIISSKPTVTGASICAGNVATLTVSGGDTYTWYDAPGGNVVGAGPSFTTPVLNTTKTYYVVVSSNGCTSAPTPVTAKVSPPPQAPTAQNQSVCSGLSANLHADGQPGVVFNWYNVPFGGTPLISSPDYTTPPLFATTIYYVETSLNQCESPRTKVVVTVSPLPQTPSAQSDTICYGTSASLTGAKIPTGTYQWYDAAVGGNLLATGTTFNTPVLTNSTTYYVQGNNGGCVSPRAPVDVIVKQQLPVPSVSGAIICPGSVATLTATGPGGIYSWYNAAAGGNILATGTSFTTPQLKATTTYYVQTNISGCISKRSAVTVSVLPSILPPTASNTSVCSGNSATLTASGPNNTYAWYDSANGGNLLSQAQVFVTPTLTITTIYYVETSSNGCTSSRTPVKVTVNPNPAPPTANGTSVCPGSSATLTATSAGGTIQWYDAPAGGNLLKTGKSYTTPVLLASTTYYVQNTGVTCISPRTPVTVSVIPVADPQFQYPSGTFCAVGPNPTPVINNPSGGTFSAAPAGLVFVSTSTGEINIAASKPGSYKVSFINKGTCPHITSATISIVTVGSTSFSYNGPYCQNGVNPLPTFSKGSTPGSFSASPAGLVFVNTSTGEIDLSNSNFGTYTITNTINATGGCPASVATTTVTIDQLVTVSAGPPQTVKAGSTVQLAGSISGGITTGKWSGGTGSFSNPSLPNAVYTPGPGEAVATLTLTSNDPPGPCGPKSDKVTITFGTNPSAPTAAGMMICSGSVATLSATAPGGTYHWYDANAGGTLLATGPTFTTPPLAASTTYYVETTNNGITSSRTAVTVAVNTPPVAPTAPGAQVCEGNITTLTASGSAGTYQWYDAPTGGNLLSANKNYVTPRLTTNVSYYVETTAGGCTSTRTQVDVTVTPIPHITSSSTGIVCSGDALNYIITADQPTATFLWSRAKVAGISNPGVVNQTSPVIGETLINTTPNTIKISYSITPVTGNCTGPAFNFIVTVNPTPIVTSSAKATICNISTDDYAVTFSTPVSQFSWSRAAVPGISNAAVSGQTASIIKEVLFNTTSSPIDVTYVFNYKTNACTATPFNLVITVNPTAVVTSSPTGVACTGTPQDYVITSNIPLATFSWSRDAVTGISNPAVANKISGTINENLINTSPSPVGVVYMITPFTNGCPGTPFKYTVTVNPALAVPVANCNSPVCVGSTIHLRTTPVIKATYSWTGPNGYTSSLENPDISNVSAANAGTYTLVVTVNGCASLPATTEAVVNQPPVANAGPDQVICIANPSILLAGSVTGGTTTGIWTTTGTGVFSPASDVLKAQYFPTAADKAAGSVTLILTSTSKDDCNISTDSMTVRFGPLPAVNAGPDQEVCSQTTIVNLKGAISIPGGGVWSTSGTGTFSPSANQLDANYLPSTADVKKGGLTLTLLAANPGVCFIPSDSMKIKFIPPPTVNAGGLRYVLKDRTITLNPFVSDSNVHYLWSPNIDINNDTLKNPVITGDIDRTYILTVTDSRGCIAQDSTFIKVSPPIVINNTFTPNGDGINDLWEITGLIAYEQATVDIFDRYGQKIFHSLGYPKAFDGTYNGRALPVGVYYYVINTNFYGQVLSGYVTIIR
jgi:gliding motility-associated-like protein